MLTNYLGPDPDAEIFLEESVLSIEADDGSSATGVVLGVTFSAILVLLTMLAAFPLARKELFRKFHLLVRRDRLNKLTISNGTTLEEEVATLSQDIGDDDSEELLR